MSTDNELVQQVLLDLDGFTSGQERFALLGANITSSDTTITVSSNVVLGQGIVQIGSELIYVGSVNQTSGQMSNCIRGYRGTLAAAHTTGDPITEAPRVPVVRVQRAINETLAELPPRVVAVKEEEITLTGATPTYEMPVDCLDVISVSYEVPGYQGLWPKSRRWQFHRSAADFTSGRSIDLIEGVPGYRALVVYQAAPTALSFNGGSFEGTNLPYWAEDLVRAGALAKIATMLDAANFTAWSASQHMLNQSTPIGGSLRLAQYFLATYEDKIVKAQARQRREWDFLTHYKG